MLFTPVGNVFVVIDAVASEFGPAGKAVPIEADPAKNVIIPEGASSAVGSTRVAVIVTLAPGAMVDWLACKDKVVGA